ALLVKVFATSASTTIVAAYSVGQQIAIAAFTALMGLGAVVFIFRFRSFKEAPPAGRAPREAGREAERTDGRLEDDPFDALEDEPPGPPRTRSARLRY